MGKDNVCGNGGCGCSENATRGFEDKTPAKKAAKRTIEIEFLYLDLNVCDQCKGSESNLEEALADVSRLLEKTGVEVNLTKTQVESFEQALALGFISSPTIRVGGRDVAIEVKENYCSSCSELSGDETYCRVWNFGGEEFSTAPKSLVIDAILKEIYGTEKSESASEISAEQIAKSHDNLKRFFKGRRAQSDSSVAEISEPVSATVKTEPTNSGGCGCS